MSDQATKLPTALEAMAAVMEEVRSVRKGDRNPEQGYMFRGIDAVTNAVGPAMRKHGIVPVPLLESINYRDVQTSRGKPSHEVTVQVRYRFYGPAGDHIEAVVPGEAMDFQDKGTAKAMSVAMRIVLLQTFVLPTDDPDPDSYTYERDNEPAIQLDPLAQARSAIAEAWTTKHGGLDTAEVENAFAEWSQGEIFAEAIPARLREFAAYIAAEEGAAEQSPPITARQLTALHASFSDCGITADGDKRAFAAEVLGHEVKSSKHLTRVEAGVVMNKLKAQLDAAVKADAESAAEPEAEQPGAEGEASEK